MALTQFDHFYEMLARLETDADPTKGRVVGMHVAKERRITDDETDTVVATSLLPAEPLDFVGLAALMTDDQLAALKAAVDAEIAGRV